MKYFLIIIVLFLFSCDQQDIIHSSENNDRKKQYTLVVKYSNNSVDTLMVEGKNAIFFINTSSEVPCLRMRDDYGWDYVACYVKSFKVLK